MLAGFGEEISGSTYGFGYFYPLFDHDAHVHVVGWWSCRWQDRQVHPKWFSLAQFAGLSDAGAASFLRSAKVVDGNDAQPTSA